MHDIQELGRTRPAHTKIVATVGPACQARDMLKRLFEAGADVFRINTAHGSQEEWGAAVEAIRSIESEVNHPIGILVDLAGPKIRLGELEGGKIECAEGDEYVFVRTGQNTEPNHLTVTYKKLIEEVKIGDDIVLADGSVHMEVVSKTRDSCTTRVIQGGTIKSRQGVNLPGVEMSVPSLTERDIKNAIWATEQEVDFLSLSFVRRAADIDVLRQLLAAHDCSAQIIAKIEKRAALRNLHDIIEAADGVMVARGDLGVEIDVAKMAITQKEIIAACNKALKPVITATQMLESMHTSWHPTRAEATDVANAILDGTDACMLSGETAVGQYPERAVKMMNRIAMATEPTLTGLTRRTDAKLGNVNAITQAAVRGAATIALELDARMVVVGSHSGRTALAFSKMRVFVPTLGISDDWEALRRMTLTWGVTPFYGAPTGNMGELVHFMIGWGVEHGWLAKGDRVILVRGQGLVESADNAVLIHEVH